MRTVVVLRLVEGDVIDEGAGSAALRDTIFVMPFSDTSPEANAIQFEVYRRMTGEQRLKLAVEMSEASRELRKAGIREQHPDWDEAKVMRELIRLVFLPEPLPERLR